MRRAIASLFALVTVLVPSLASACPVCGQGREGTESALLIMSGVMSALPLVMAGGIVLWIVLRVRAAAHELPARAVEEPSEQSSESRQ